MTTERLQTLPQKPRVFILSAISNEPDDAESLVRYLLYANQFTTEGLVAGTSTWMKTTVHPESIEKIIGAYANVVDNLNKHVHPDHPYPSAQYLQSLVKRGAEVCPTLAMLSTVIAIRSRAFIPNSQHHRPTACPPLVQTSPSPQVASCSMTV